MRTVSILMLMDGFVQKTKQNTLTENRTILANNTNIGSDVLMGEIDYKRECQNLIAELIGEKQKHIYDMQYEMQSQKAMADIELQNAMIQMSIKQYN